MAAPVETPILIVGGSIVGLSAAAFLAAQGLKPLLVERRRNLSRRLRAKVFYARTMELYRAIGIEDAIMEAEPAGPRPNEIAIVESLAGVERKRWTMPAARDLGDLSPCKSAFLKQRRLEEIVRERASELGADMRFSTELLSFSHDDAGVTAHVCDHTTGEEYDIRAKFMIAADGNGSSIRDSLGIARTGPGELSHSMDLTFEGDLRPLLRERPLAFVYLRRPDLLAYIGWEATLDGGTVSVYYDPAAPDLDTRFNDENCQILLESALGSTDGSFRVLAHHAWGMSAWVAERYRVGRIFLVGDAAHVTPPVGGFGANLGIHDAHNLAAKLAAALFQGAANILDTYEEERLPVGRLTVSQATLRLRDRPGMAERIGDTGPVLDEAAITLGYRYRSRAVLSNDWLGPDALDPNALRGQPGTRAPHVPISRVGLSSTLDLYRRNFVLLTGSQANSWCEAAAEMRQMLDVYRCHVDFGDSRGAVLAAHGMTETDAVLIRPDGFVGWASSSEPARKDNLAQRLAAALQLAGCCSGP